MKVYNLESHSTEFNDYWFLSKLALPEIISAFLIVFLPVIADFCFISSLQNSTATLAFGASTNLIHLFNKFAESLAVAVATQVGFFNGARLYLSAGRVLYISLIISLGLGLGLLTLSLFAAKPYLLWLGCEPSCINLASKFIVTQVAALCCLFVFMTLVGFFRGVKNTFLPMTSLVLSTAVFLISDYLLIFGKLGFPQMGIFGSSLASVLRYATGSAILAGYLIAKPQYRGFLWQQSFIITLDEIKELVKFIFPILLDKSVIALAYIWLYKLIIPLGATAVLVAEVIKNLERLAFIPATAFSQVTNFTLSNDFGARDFSSAERNLKMILMLTIIPVFIILTLFLGCSSNLAKLFNANYEQTLAIGKVMKCVSLLVIFDVCHVIFASALRAFKQVQTVAKARAIFFLLFYLPVSMIIELITACYVTKLCLFYGFFYLTLSLISVYLNRSLWSLIRTSITV